MEIKRIPALFDNYIFLIYDLNKQVAAVVDPAEYEPVVKILRELALNLVAIFNTHHHSDHVGANRQLIKDYPDVCVYGGAEDRGRIPGQQVFLRDGDSVKFCGHIAEIFFVPGHTKGHIAYYFPPIQMGETGELFCGDTLFAGGCGRLFEGTPADMVKSLTKLRNLPDNTRIWCAHEYTLNNLKFALTVDGQNPDLQQRYEQVQTQRNQDIPTIPSILGIEKLTNPFLRWDKASIQKAMTTQEPIEVFRRLRGKKDLF